MNKLSLIVLTGMVAFLTFDAPAADHPDLLAAALGNGVVFISKGEVVKKLATPGATQDAWQLKDGSVLAAGMKGVWKYDRDGKIIFKYQPDVKGKYEIHSCMPLPDGKTLVSIGGTKQLVELDPAGKPTKTVTVEGLKSNNAHMQMRNCRKCKNGDYVVVASGEERVLVVRPDGKTKRDIDMKKLPEGLKTNKVHGMTVLKNGNLLIGTGYGSCLVEMDGDDKIVWQLTAKDVPEIGLKYLSGIQRLANGNTVISAYKSKYCLFEVTPEKKVVWKIPGGGKIGKPTHVQVLSEKGDPSCFELCK